MKINRKVIVAAGIAASLIGFSACSSEAPSSSSSSSLNGSLVGSGSTAQQAAQTAWRAKFTTIQPGIKVSYNGGGSGKGQSDFKSGAVSFAGSDTALTSEQETAGGFANCAANTSALNVPVYISPIAIVFHLDGVTKLNLDAATTAGIFSGAIKQWNDPKITTLNPGVNLPDKDITVVHRSDQSGTTQNFTDTLNKTAPSVWTQAASQTWPATYGGESASGTSGVVSAVKNGAGTIGYADMGQADGLSMASFGKDGTFAAPSDDDALKVVNASPVASGRAANDLALTLDRTASGYPFVLVSYALVCQQYKDASTGALVRSYLTYVTSTDGQNEAKQQAGSAPLAGDLQTKVKNSVASIK